MQPVATSHPHSPAAITSLTDTSVNPALRIQPAGFVSRLLAFVFDVLIVMSGSLVFAALISMVLSYFGFSAQAATVEPATKNLRGVLQLVVVVVAGLVQARFILAYVIVFRILVGTTPGKQVMGLRITRTQRQQVGWGRAIVRLCGYWLSAIILFLGFLRVFVDPRRQGWHDKLADTIVVYAWEVREVEYSAWPGSKIEVWGCL